MTLIEALGTERAKRTRSSGNTVFLAENNYPFVLLYAANGQQIWLTTEDIEAQDWAEA